MLGNIPLLRGLGIVGLANLSLLCLIAVSSVCPALCASGQLISVCACV